MIPSFSLHAHAPWAIMPDRLTDSLAALAAERPRRKPLYKMDEGGMDMEEDWSLAAQQNNARLMIQKVGPTTAVLQIKGMILKDCPFECWLYGIGANTSDDSRRAGEYLLAGRRNIIHRGSAKA